MSEDLKKENTEPSASQDQEVIHPENQEEQKAQEEPKDQEKNWAAVREVIKYLKEENELLKKQQAESKKQPEPDEFEGVDPTDYATVDMVKQPSKKIKDLEKQLDTLQQTLKQTQASAQEEKMRSTYQDYDYVIEKFGIPLINNNPELAKALKAMPNWAEMAYNMAKSTPEYQKSLNKEPSEKAEKVLKNIERPVSANAAGSSFKSQANYFANLSPSEVWKKSQEFARKA